MFTPDVNNIKVNLLACKNRKDMFKLMILAGCGGFIGTCCRYLTNRFYLSYFKTSLPLATFTVNILGCLAVGIILGLLNRNGLVSPKLNAFLVVGFCGGFTTFSTFSFEAFTLGLNGETLMSLIYVGTSILVGLLAVWAGLLISNG